jgi:PAS domain S-box-containing protein
MNWATAIWSILIGGCVAIALPNLLVGLWWRRASHLFFVAVTLAVIGVATTELFLIWASSVDHFIQALRWLQLPIFVLVVSLTGFVYFYFGTGRLWLGLATCATRLACLVLSFILPAGLHFREITGLRHFRFLGETVAAPRGVLGSWAHLGEISSLLFLAFVIDASVGLWRKGGNESRRRAAVVGGSIVFAVLVATGLSELVHQQLMDMPYLGSFPFAAIVLAMGFELGSDLFRAGEVAQKLERSEASLHESEKRFRTMADAAPVMIWMSGPDKLCTFFNKAWLEFTGRRMEQELGNGWSEGVHVDDFDMCLKTQVTAFDARKPFVKSYRLRRFDGEYRFVRDSGMPRHDADGNFLGYVGACMDMTDFIQTQELFRLTTEASSSGILLVTSDGRIVLVNAQTEKLFGYTRDELIGELVEILVPERFTGHSAHREAFVARPEARMMGAGRDLFGRRKDGSEFPLEIGLNPIQTPQGTLVLATVINITARKTAEEQALKSREQIDRLTRISLLGEMTASIAHELNQPLSAIVSNANAGRRFLDRGELKPEAIREILEDVGADARRAHDVIHHIRNTIKKGAAVRERINLNEVVNHVAHSIRPDARIYSCEIETLLAKRLPEVEGDPVQIQQVLINLVSNAFDAMADIPAKRRKVEIKTERNGDGTVCVSVRDHGVGIREEARERLFEQFFTTKPDGLGMGLAIVRSIIETHGGQIGADNVDGGGARFYFTLPAVEANRR